MGINGIGGPGNYPSTTAMAAKAPDATQQFLDYMKKPALVRMQEAWLAAHGITKEKLAQMTGPEREALMKQMAEDIKRQIEEAAMKRGAAWIF